MRTYGDKLRIEFGKDQTLDLEYSDTLKIFAQWEESHCGCCSADVCTTKSYSFKELFEAMKNIDTKFKQEESRWVKVHTNKIDELNMEISKKNIELAKKDSLIAGLQLTLQEFRK